MNSSLIYTPSLSWSPFVHEALRLWLLKHVFTLTLVSLQLDCKVLEDKQGVPSLIPVPFTPSPSPTWQLPEDRGCMVPGCRSASLIAASGQLLKL